MKKLLPILALILAGCDEPIIRRTYVGDLTSLRIDDDAEFHFSTDNITESDINDFNVDIRREDCDQPQLFVYEKRCPEGKTCSEASNDKWTRSTMEWSITLPKDYKIETFDD